MRRPAIVLLFAILLWPWAASAEKRVALIIGNGAYIKVSKLANPTRDADAMEALFRAAGFDVVDTRRDLDALAMRRTLRNFSDRVRGADVAVMFFAGHGIEVNGTNFLIPVDATLERDIDVEDETVPLERITQILEPARRLRLVILDACRDNPFVRSMKRTITGRSIGRGLAEVRVLTADTLIAFAARAGSTAADGDGGNSPYTTALVKHLPTPGLDLRLALGRVRDDVLKSTSHGQEPFVYGSLGGAEIALVSAASPVREAAPPAPPTVSEAERAWASIKDSKHVSDFEAYRRQYGKANLFYDGLAARRIEELRTEAAAAKTQAEADAKRRQEEGIAAKKKASEDAKQQAAAAKKQADADAKRREEESTAAKKRAAEEAQRRADAAAAAKKVEQEAAARARAEAETKRRSDEAARAKQVAAATPASPKKSREGQSGNAWMDGIRSWLEGSGPVLEKDAQERTIGTISPGTTLRLRVPSAFGSALPQLGRMPGDLSKEVERISNGKIELKIFEPGSLVPALEILDAVGKGTVEAGWTSANYAYSKDTAFDVFSAAIPFGLAPNRVAAWLQGEGGVLKDQLYQRFGAKGFTCGMIGPEGAGWFKKRINAVEDLKGLKMRFFGIGAQVVRKLGVATQLLAAGDIYPALEKGVLDATEFSTPLMDVKLGFWKVANYYYYPAWHQPASVADFVVNLKLWQGLSNSQQNAIEVACQRVFRRSVEAIRGDQKRGLAELAKQGVNPLVLPGVVLNALEVASREVLAEEAAKSATYKSALDSYNRYR